MLFFNKRFGEWFPACADQNAFAELVDALDAGKMRAVCKNEWRCRIGVNSGTVIGSIVGVQKYVAEKYL